MTRSGMKAFALVALLATGCLQAGPGACSDEERAVFDSIEHFEGMRLEAEDHATGACGARFDTTAAPQVITDHYERELVGDGWVIGAPGLQPDGSPVEMPPGYLQARRGDMAFSVEIPPDGGDQGNVTVLVGKGL